MVNEFGYGVYVFSMSGVPQPVRNRAAQQEVSGRLVREASSAAAHRSHSCLNHRPPPPRSEEKLSFTKPVPGATNVGDCCSMPFLQLFCTCEITSQWKVTKNSKQTSSKHHIQETTRVYQLGWKNFSSSPSPGIYNQLLHCKMELSPRLQR